MAKTLTFALMDPPFENARSTTALRLMDLALKRGYNVNVFAYEGAVGLAFAKQTQHPNAVHGRDTAQEDHPLTRDWIAANLPSNSNTPPTRPKVPRCGSLMMRSRSSAV